MKTNDLYEKYFAGETITKQKFASIEELKDYIRYQNKEHYSAEDNENIDDISRRLWKFLNQTLKQ